MNCTIISHFFFWARISLYFWSKRKKKNIKKLSDLWELIAFTVSNIFHLDAMSSSLYVIMPALNMKKCTHFSTSNCCWKPFRSCFFFFFLAYCSKSTCISNTMSIVKLSSLWIITIIAFIWEKYVVSVNRFYLWSFQFSAM